MIPSPGLEAVRLDMVFPGSLWTEHKPLVSETTINTLREGTRQHNAGTIAELFDYYGSYIITYNTRDYAGISLYSLSRHTGKVVEILEDILRNPIFPEKEVQTWLKQEQQSFIIEAEKVSYQSHAAFREKIFGAGHPYGEQRQISHYGQIRPADLQQWHSENIHCNNCFMVLTGEITDDLLKDLEERFGGDKDKTSAVPRQVSSSPPSSRTKVCIRKESALQSAITLGKRTINRDHPDFPALSYTLTLLGGYFGSRLMRNIREEKGYTYGISASVKPLKRDAYLSIHTEVGAEVCNPALKEIYKEIRQLRETSPGEEEMTLVRNYLMGNLLQSLDGALARSDMIKRLMVAEVSFDYLDRFAREINGMTARKVTETAEKYLNPDEMTEVVAGKCDNEPPQ
jgi:predicted Zn-dependent peptidase